MKRSKDEMTIDELKLVEAREARADALKALFHAKNQLAKASVILDQMAVDFQKTRIPVRRIAIRNRNRKGDSLHYKPCCYLTRIFIAIGLPILLLNNPAQKRTSTR